MEIIQHIDTENSLAELRNKQSHILIVEDERLVCWSLEQALTKAGFAVTSVIDGNEAMAKIKSFHYDMIITDFDLPGMNGDVLASQAKMSFQDIPVILTGAFSENDSKLSGKHGLFDLFFEKPYSLNEIIEHVKRLLSLKSVENIYIRE